MASPERKERSEEERVVQLEDLRTLLKEERVCLKEELKSEIKTLSTSMTQTLGELQSEGDRTEHAGEHGQSGGNRKAAGRGGEPQHDPGI